MVAPYSKHEVVREPKSNPTVMVNDSRLGPIVIDSKFHDTLVTVFSGVLLIVFLELFVKIGKTIKNF